LKNDAVESEERELDAGTFIAEFWKDSGLSPPVMKHT
jgi:hypothetical protein